MKKKYQVRRLSERFYSKYNEIEYPEIERKNERPYVVVLVKINMNTFALPFRTNIKHNACYKFKCSGRKTNYMTGLDFSKAVVVNDDKYTTLRYFHKELEIKK